MEQIKTRLEYMGVNIPVIITNNDAGLPKMTIESDGCIVIQQYSELQFGTNEKIAIERTGAIAMYYESSLIVYVSDEAIQGTASKEILSSIRSIIYAHLKYTFDTIDSFKNVMIYVPTSNLMNSVLDYITDRYEDFERLSIYVNNPYDSDAIYNIRDSIECNKFIHVKEEWLMSQIRCYGANGKIIKHIHI